MEEKVKILNTNKKEISDANDLLVSPHRNPNQYNGEVLEPQYIAKKNPNSKQVYIESYGCQMNFADSEVVASILTKEGYTITERLDQATLV